MTDWNWIKFGAGFLMFFSMSFTPKLWWFFGYYLGVWTLLSIHTIFDMYVTMYFCMTYSWSKINADVTKLCRWCPVIGILYLMSLCHDTHHIYLIIFPSVPYVCRNSVTVKMCLLCDRKFVFHWNTTEILNYNYVSSSSASLVRFLILTLLGLTLLV